MKLTDEEIEAAVAEFETMAKEYLADVAAGRIKRTPLPKTFQGCMKALGWPLGGAKAKKLPKVPSERTVHPRPSKRPRKAFPVSEEPIVYGGLRKKGTVPPYRP